MPILYSSVFTEDLNSAIYFLCFFTDLKKILPILYFVSPAVFVFLFHLSLLKDVKQLLEVSFASVDQSREKRLLPCQSFKMMFPFLVYHLLVKSLLSVPLILEEGETCIGFDTRKTLFKFRRYRQATDKPNLREVSRVIIEWNKMV